MTLLPLARNQKDKKVDWSWSKINQMRYYVNKLGLKRSLYNDQPFLF